MKLTFDEYSRTHIEINLKHLCHIMKLPNEGDQCYLTTTTVYQLLVETKKKFILSPLTLAESLELLTI